MTTKYSAPAVEAIQEDSEDDFKGELSDKHDTSPLEIYYRQQRPLSDSMMAPVRANTGRERRRRTHKPAGGDRHLKNKGRDGDVKRGNGMIETDRPRIRHGHTLSNRTPSSTSSSENEEELQDHREVLAHARARLTSPSTISTFTSLTQSTNKSSGSSGSNSTVTQASVTKQSLEKRSEIQEAPMSPAVPDAPDVFAYLDNESSTCLIDENAVDDHEGSEEEDHSASEDDDEERIDAEDSQWPSHEYTPLSTPHISPDQGSASSSASSSIHGSDHFSEPLADNDTDRSTSPERSVKDHTSDQEHETCTTDPASTKLASQMAAAQQRQNLHASTAAQTFGTPNMARGTAVYPYIAQGSALSPRYPQHVKTRSLPRAEKLPVTGYELLASRLSHASTESEEAKIRPMYRKFEALNHRLLLHLQDEISELEERLHRLDHADTQARTAGLSGSVLPASRRAAQAAGGELQWHKTDVLGRIGFKLAQYNQALAAFHQTQGLSPPSPTDISLYRSYLHSEQPIAEVETHFLDPTDDLVSVCSDRVPRSSTSFSPETQTSYASSVDFIARSEQTVAQPPGLSGLAVAIAVAVLVPILTFSVIPGFIGRMTVVGLVAGGVVGALMQSGIVGRSMFRRDGLICGGIYGGVMIVVAGIMA